MITIGHALRALRPGSEWVIREGVIEWLDVSTTQPTAEEIAAEMERQEMSLVIKQRVDAVQAELDRQAKSLGYDNIFTAITYAGNDEFADPMLAKFQAEGNAFKAWRSKVWVQAYEMLEQVEAGQIPLPSPAEAVAMMPALELPSVEPELPPDPEPEPEPEPDPDPQP